MAAASQENRQWWLRVAALSNPALFVLLFAAVLLSHLNLLRLPYFWDEGGYYIPAALDFYRHFRLIPEYTNAHPPLPNVVLGALWHVFGANILVTRLIVSGFASAALLAVFRLGVALLDAPAAVVLVALTAIYPIWFAQSTLAHADIFSAAFTLWAFALYFQIQTDQTHAVNNKRVQIAVLFSLAALSKETAIIQPAALTCFHLLSSMGSGDRAQQRRWHVQWCLALAFPVFPLGAWYVYHRLRTGFTFGNPEYLRYNATANLTLSHFFTALRYRFIHLTWQRNIWFPILVAIAAFLLLKRGEERSRLLPPPALRIISLLVLANWLAFSVLGGALLTRYLLPAYPLILLLCIAVWRTSTPKWAWLAALTGVSFLIALWWSPPAAYAPEDSLTYRDMIVVHQQAIAFIDQQYPSARVLTAWPASAELYHPELGYTDRKIMGPQIDNFSAEEIEKAAREPDQFDTALVFSKNFVPPSLSHYLAAHPNSTRARRFSRYRDLTPAEVATRLGGDIVFSREQNGEWAAVLRFPRRYNAQLVLPLELK